MSEKKSLIGESNNKCIAYVDGSYNIRTKYCGYGVVLFYNGEHFEFSGCEPNAESLGRNVFGEIKGSMKAVTEAKKLGAKEIEIRYDYTGIEYWVTGKWQANKVNTKEYRDFMRNAEKEIKITFTKVKAHSSNQWNDRADILAKEAIGI